MVRRATPYVRFLRHVQEPEGPSACWEWMGAKGRHGYGSFNAGGRKTMLAHRWAYEFCRGSIPRDKELDHVCRNRACVNPEHLEPVSHRENMKRSPVVMARHQKTHCVNGHPYTEENTYHPPGCKVRMCRICRQRSWRKAYYTKKNKENS